jgi:biopolymer transport protein TolQ
MKIIYLLYSISEAASPQVSVNTGAFDAILQASPVVQLTLLILVGLSVVSWAVGYAKYQQFKKMSADNDTFSAKFFKVSSLDSLYENLDQYEYSSLARVFKAGYQEMQHLADSHYSNKNSKEEKAPKLSGIDNLERSLRKAMDNEISLMENKLNWLATTGSTGPFIGLFGTVWGIMTSFHKIGATGSASLAVVAPGISEALVATAIGLAAAIPAVVLYNHFTTQLRKQEIELSNFSTDFLNIVKRNFFRGE